MTDKHLSTQFDAELSGISTRVLEMGGLVESQVAQAVEALGSFSGDIASHVLKQEEIVNTMEIEIDRDLSTIIARRQPTARDLRLLGVAGQRHLVTGVTQVDGDQLGDGGFVLDDQDATHAG